jgi:hypothetical protein
MVLARDGPTAYFLYAIRSLEITLTLFKRLVMKSICILPVSLCLFFLSPLKAQVYNTKIDTQEVIAFRYLIYFISHGDNHHDLYTTGSEDSPPVKMESRGWNTYYPNWYNIKKTVGSPYLVPSFVRGVAIDPLDSATDRSDYLYNYNKASGNLLLKKNNAEPIAVYKDQVKMFCLKLEQGGYIFMTVPLINSNEFFQVIAKGPKYSCYKLYKNIFVPYNQTATNGYLPEGKDYDEYKDILTYYIVDEKAESSSVFDLTKKSIRQVLSSESLTVEQFFKKHKFEEVTENMVSELLEELNK